MAITYFGSAATPGDNVGGSTSPTAVTPPIDMVTGDLVLLIGYYRGASTVAMSEAGGQTWTNTTAYDTASHSFLLSWARYDGTWDASPSMSSSATTNGFTVVMHVFRPTAGGNTWGVDVAEATGTYAAPANPYDVSLAEITIATGGAVALFMWTSADDNSWTIQTAGWANAGTAQYRNGTGADGSVSFAYQVFPSSGGTGAAVNRQVALGGDSGAYQTVAFKEVAAAGTSILRQMMQHHGG